MALPDETDALSKLNDRELKFWGVIDDLVEKLGFRLTDVEFGGGARGRVSIRLYIMSQTGVTLKDCETVSREVASHLEVTDYIKGSYTLDVSSAGLTRSLKRRAHFEEEIGNEASFVFKGDFHGMHKEVGVIEAVFEKQGKIFIKAKFNDQVYDIPMTALARANKHFAM